MVLKRVIFSFLSLSALLLGSFFIVHSSMTVDAALLSAADSTLPSSLVEQSQETAGVTGQGQNSLPTIVGNIVQVILSVIGIAFLVIVLYAGTLWMTAEGDENKVGKARGMLFHGVIGLAIVLAAYAITYFVVESIARSVNIS